MTEVTTRAREAAERGAALLDKKRPGWEQAVDLDKLDMRSGCWCVLGQQFDTEGRYMNRYERAMMELVLVNGHDPASLEDSERIAEEHGFLALGRVDEYNYWDELDRAWRQIVMERQSAFESDEKYTGNRGEARVS